MSVASAVAGPAGPVGADGPRAVPADAASSPGVVTPREHARTANAPRSPTARPEAAHAVVLVHGLDEVGSIFNGLRPELRDAGFRVVDFSYPNDQGIARSGGLLRVALARLRREGVSSITLVGHSMGGLVSRSALAGLRPATGDPTVYVPESLLPEVRRLITVGTPHSGAPLARARWVLEAREHWGRFLQTGEWELLWDWSADGEGQAGVDLRPGSNFLGRLGAQGEARLHGRAVPTTCVVGRLLAVDEDDDCDLYRDVSDAVGDGAVPAPSQTVPWAARTVELTAGHRSLLSSGGLDGLAWWLPEAGGAIAVVLDQLRADSDNVGGVAARRPARHEPMGPPRSLAGSATLQRDAE